MVDSWPYLCQLQGRTEQYCENFPTFTYNGNDKFLGGQTYGGYSDSITVDEAYTLKVPVAWIRRRRLHCVRGDYYLLSAHPLEGGVRGKRR